MNKKQKTRLTIILSVFLVISAAISLVLFALKQNIDLFYTPTQLNSAQVNPDQTIRIGGFVKKNSVHFDNSGQSVTFIVTDNTNDLPVDYHGLLPNLFREGQGVVIEGKINASHIFDASQVLAKHDEKYMPRFITEPRA